MTHTTPISSAEANNPLLQDASLPPFSAIKPEHVRPALDTLLAQCRSVISQVAADSGPATWDSVIAPLETAGEALGNAWSPVSHLANVQDSEALREVYREGVQLINTFDTEYKQHAGLYARYEALRDGPGYADLTAAQKTALKNALLGGELSGITLPPEQQAQYKALSAELSALETRYSENVLDATQGWSYLVTDESELAGLPESARDTLAENAKQADQEGWLVNLEFPSYLPVMTYAENRALRQRVHEAFNTRASDQGPNAGQWDNGPVMADIMDKRQQMAKLLGFDSYAELSLVTKMADSPATVTAFLNDLATKARPQGQQEFAELKAFAQQELGFDTLEAWDVGFASERLKLAQYTISDEQLRPYFPTDRVLSGLFETVERLYDVAIEPVEDVDVYHPDVQLFNVTDHGQVIARFYLDLYARAGKRGGAWMDVCRVRRKVKDQVHLPVAYLTCNFTAPVNGKPSLLNHDDVTTLFHEFGHGLHHMLTEVDVADVSGIHGVAWDAVELPSQFMENFCWEPEALAFISGHVDTGEPLPKALLDNMLRARNFQAAMQMLRQIEFSLFDFELHLSYEPGHAEQIAGTLSAVREGLTVVPIAPYARFENSFSHVFAGGYAAGYYSYKWAEVLSADAFSRFETEGIFAQAPAQAFRQHILAAGGSAPAADLFRAFRGREPDIEPLLRHSGIQTAA